MLQLAIPRALGQLVSFTFDDSSRPLPVICRETTNIPSGSADISLSPLLLDVSPSRSNGLPDHFHTLKVFHNGRRAWSPHQSFHPSGVFRDSLMSKAEWLHHQTVIRHHPATKHRRLLTSRQRPPSQQLSTIYWHLSEIDGRNRPIDLSSTMSTRASCNTSDVCKKTHNN